MAELVLEKLHKSFGSVNVIPSVDLEIEKGEFVVFVGPSGCGKSTLLRLVAGLENATSGDIKIDDKSVIRTAAAERGVAMVFQSYALYPHMTVYKNLSFGLENIRMDKKEIDKRIQHASKLLQIDHLLERRPSQLSGGQRQRVAIGRSIVREPKIFLFDEPLSNLDAELRVVMRTEIKKLHDRLGNTMIYVTHDQVEAMTMADKIVVLRLGNVEQVGAPLDLYNDPDNKFVGGFIGSPAMNFLESVVESADASSMTLKVGSDKLTLAHKNMPVKAGQKVTLGIRPEHFELVDSKEGSLSAKVEVADQHGSSTYMHAKSSADEQLQIYIEGQHEAHSGEILQVKPKGDLWYLFDENELRICNKA